MSNNLESLKNKLSSNGLTVLTDHELAPYTTWKIGGKADLFIHVRTTDQLVFAVNTAKELDVNYTILGWGSNVLISDKGIRGLVIKNSAQEIIIKGETNEIIKTDNKIEARLQVVDKKNYYDFSDLDYDESSYPTVEVSVASGTYLPYLINTLIDKGVTGLQWFSGIPGTIGGAVFNNIHGGNRFIGEFVKSVDVLTEVGERKILDKSELSLDYDYSVFHTNHDVILGVNLLLHLGDKNRAKNTSIAWATRKRLQPPNSAGCCFQNLDKSVQESLNLESNSWGYIIDKVLNLKGYTVGKAMVSPKHAAFIETQKGAKASDILNIFDKIYPESYKKLKITPRNEIFFLGFEASEVERFTKPRQDSDL